MLQLKFGPIPALLAAAVRHSPRRGTKIPRSIGRLAAIKELLERDTVAAEVVRYLDLHSDAADTARGIAEWWIRRDVVATAQALARLLEFGVVDSYPVQDATSVYTYTKNRLLRQSLNQWLKALMGQPTPVQGS